MNDNVFCETVEILRNRVGVRLSINSKSYWKLVSKPRFAKPKTFGKI